MKNVNVISRFCTKLTLLAVLASFVFIACKDDNEVRPRTITDVVNENDDLSILRAAIQQAGLGDALRTGTLTLLAPSNAAFQSMGIADAAGVSALTADSMRTILLYHVLDSSLKTADIRSEANQSMPTLASKPTYITKTPTVISINGARITSPDIAADNGLIHIIDKVLSPPRRNLLQIAQSNPDLSFLLAAATRAALASPTVLAALNSEASAITILAPTNQAFKAAGFATEASLNAANPATLAGILLYHVVPGRIFSTNFSNGTLTTASAKSLKVDTTNGIKITGNGNGTMAARITKADQLATNGLIHTIDMILLP
jgi:uncharacterized surface protein with fasciclin (FAS1) repeats